MTLEEFARMLKADLLKNNNPQNIIERIMKVHHDNGTYLSLKEKEKVINYLKGIECDRKGRRIITDSDNSAYLSLVNIVAQAITNNGVQ